MPSSMHLPASGVIVLIHVIHADLDQLVSRSVTRQDWRWVFAGNEIHKFIGERLRLSFSALQIHPEICRVGYESSVAFIQDGIIDGKADCEKVGQRLVLINVVFRTLDRVLVAVLVHWGLCDTGTSAYAGSKRVEQEMESVYGLLSIARKGKDVP
ncbi:hypothetical protein N7519_009246 [Penicillium mononematosum]|uniref:uncharacterized protein n=1 Tax=Penicillium mononematosum TaxID=268346 RepID=UPI002547139B|nr:uncharacterized protein N7519_009246 [Penicillium mononematosum]KAJ6178785.1 hypothetical protein N7519_009246 [Penicillium mononematosum]